MSITFTGLNSVSGRTLFTKRGPIVKAPIAVLSGSNLQVVSPTDVVIPTGAFTSAHVGFRLDISGSANSRNDGSFYISAVRSSTRLTLENASLTTADSINTTADIISLANSIRSAYNAHILAPGIHNIIDTSHLVTTPVAVDLASANILLNEIATKASLHFLATVGIHPTTDVDDSDLITEAARATGIASSLLLANTIRRAYELHRQNTFSHPTPDDVDRVIKGSISTTVGTFPSPTTGPFAWTLFDPRAGQIADDPNDVVVRVGGSPVLVDAVFGLLGAIVLTVAPAPGSSIQVDYSYMNNPPTQIERLNSPEFALNQAGNRNYAGLPAHRYRMRSTLLTPSDSETVRSPTKPLTVGWKYKALERSYTAALNDPNTLLLNVPTNRVAFQGVQAVVRETVVRYDPITLPQNSTDPWTLEGDGSSLSLSAGGFELTVSHNGSAFGTSNLPPFFSHEIDLSYPSIVSAAFRARVDSFTPDGAFTGICFGLSDGAAAAIVGFLQTDALNLSSGIVLANALKKSFNAHLVLSNAHTTNDSADSIIIVDATDLASLIILANSIQLQYNAHLNKGLLDSVHLSLDSTLLSISPQATSLVTALSILNEVRVNFNAHLLSTSHVQPDLVDSVSQIKQVGVLTNRGYPENQTSWNCVAADWTIYRTYRIFRDGFGNISLFFSGVSLPVITTPVSNLPALSSIDGKFDLLQQTFFGTIGKPSSSVSKWAFIRVDIQPLDANQVSSTVVVDYEAATVPETDPSSPWIPMGQGGYDRINGAGLILDSTATAPLVNIDSLGRTTGPYRGFIRLEPTLTSRATTSLEFTGKVGYYTFSVDNLASGVYIDDDQYAVHLVFLQANPTPATILGQSTEPFSLSSQDSLSVSVNGGTPFNIFFTPGPARTAFQVATDIVNGGVPSTSVSGAVQIQTPTSGATSQITLLGGTALVKLGFLPGTYFGADSRPEPKASWFGEDRPDLDSPTWSPSGNQSSVMLGRVLRINDSSSTDFLVYGLEDSLITSQVFSSSVDWKADFRLSAVSFSQGDILAGLRFCGALFNVDEGPTGKNIELQMATDNSGNPFVHVVSYDGALGAMSSIAQFSFGWNDFFPHSFNVFTSKLSSLVIILADGVVLGTVSYSGLKPGVFGPSTSFGSGGPATANTDLRAAQSSFDWSSVCIFRDSRISDPSAPGNRYIGLYKGGDPTLLSSYYLAQIDWTNSHTYRIVRDPGSNVSVYVDNSPVPQISTNYDVLSLPPVSSSFLQQMSGGRPLVAFGSFNPQEIDRTFWKPITYSIGRITQSDNIVPPHQELNRGNAIASPDHLHVGAPHSHFGFKVYSGGTPTDDFLSPPPPPLPPGIVPDSPPPPAFTTLGERTPPIPMSQDLDSLGGLQPNFILLDSIASIDLVSQRGFLADFEDDTDNATTSNLLTYNSTLAALVSDTNNLAVLYNDHLSKTGSLGPIHVSTDPTTVGSCVDLASAISLLDSLRSRFSAHIASGAFHTNPDTVNTVSASVATDLATSLTLLSDLTRKFGAHQGQGQIHPLQDTFDAINNAPGTPALTFAYTLPLLNTLLAAFNAHLSQPGIHYNTDSGDFISLAPAVDLPTALAVATALTTNFNNHIINGFPPFHANSDIADTVISSIPVDLDTLYQSVDELVLRYQTHIAKGSPGLVGVLNIHALVDTVNTVSGIGPIRALLDQLEQFNTNLTTHRTHFSSGGSTYVFHKYEQQSSLRPVMARYNYAQRSFDFPSVVNMVNYLIASYNEHAVSISHQLPDISYIYSGGPATDLDSSQIVLTNLQNSFNSHIVGYSWHIEEPGESLDTPSSAAVPPEPLSAAIIALNELQTKYNSHVLRSRSHAHANQSHLLIAPPATDLPSLIALSNAMKTVFNLHISSVIDHVTVDAVNTITAPNATDLQSAGTLILQEVAMFNDHRTESGVHGTSVFVRLDPPAGTLYQGMKFFPVPEGDPDQTAPFSDDESSYVGVFVPPL